MNKRVDDTQTDDEDDVDVMGLSPQELAALEAGDDDTDDDDDDDDDDGDNNGDGDDDGNGTDDDDDEAAEKARAEADAAAAAEKDKDGEGGEDDDAGPDAAAAEGEGDDGAEGDDSGDDDDGDAGIDTSTHLVADDVADYDQKIAKIAEDKAALRTKLNNGDIELDEYETQKEALDDQLFELKSAKREAIFVAKQNEANAKQRWETTQEVFYAQGDNAKFYSDENHFAVFNHHIKAIAADPANVNKSGSWIINKADEKTREVFGAVKQQKSNEGEGANTENAGKDGKKPSKEPKRPDLTKVPKSLRNIPAAELEDTGDGGEFAHLDKLSGMELEAAVAAMTPEQQERYARS